MRPMTFLCGLLLLAISIAPLSAQPATSQPSTQPASRPSLRSTPGWVLVSQYGALIEGQFELLRACFLAQTDDEQAVADAYVALAQSIQGLKNAADTQYGREGFRDLGIGQAMQTEINRLAAAPIKMEDDKRTALVYALGENRPPVVVVQIEDKSWQISIARTYRNPARQAQRLRLQAQVNEELAAEILDGKYRLPSEARQARTDKLRKAMEQLGPSTRAAE